MADRTLFKKSMKSLSKYLERLGSKCHFSILPNFLASMLPWQLIKISTAQKKNTCLIEDHSKNISEAVFLKYLQRLNNKCHFSIFPL